MASNVYERDSVMGQAQSLGSTGCRACRWTPRTACCAAAHRHGRAGAGRGARYFGDDQLTVATLVPQPLAAAEAPPCRPSAAICIDAGEDGHENMKTIAAAPMRPALGFGVSNAWALLPIQHWTQPSGAQVWLVQSPAFPWWMCR
jgi:hypothetical protein